MSYLRTIPIVAALALLVSGCSTTAAIPTPAAGPPVETVKVAPLYYDDYVVYFDENEAPYYFVDHVAHYVSRNDANFTAFTAHYRLHAAAYQRWQKSALISGIERREHWEPGRSAHPTRRY